MAQWSICDQWSLSVEIEIFLFYNKNIIYKITDTPIDSTNALNDSMASVLATIVHICVRRLGLSEEDLGSQHPLRTIDTFMVEEGTEITARMIQLRTENSTDPLTIRTNICTNYSRLINYIIVQYVTRISDALIISLALSLSERAADVLRIVTLMSQHDQTILPDIEAVSVLNNPETKLLVLYDVIKDSLERQYNETMFISTDPEELMRMSIVMYNRY